MDKEVFKDIDGYEGLYQVSNYGNVKSVRGGYLLKKETTNKGYLRVNLWKDGKTKHFRVHRLVGIAFISNPNNLPQINHKDCDPSNNNVSNLEWCDNEYNQKYRINNKQIPKQKNSEQIPKQKKERICKPVIGKIVYQYKDGVLVHTFPSISEAVRNGFDSIKISLCHRGIIKTYMGYQWSYDKKGCA